MQRIARAGEFRLFEAIGGKDKDSAHGSSPVCGDLRKE
jgi:hypothetical protein